jgi:hypothetical protein
VGFEGCEEAVYAEDETIVDYPFVLECSYSVSPVFSFLVDLGLLCADE